MYKEIIENIVVYSYPKYDTHLTKNNYIYRPNDMVRVKSSIFAWDNIDIKKLLYTDLVGLL